VYVGERFNSISHLIGTAAALAGTVVLIVISALQRDPVKIVSFSIYGSMLILLYLMSTLYHSFRHPGVKAIFRKLDHLSVFLLIAGTYTPLALISLDGWRGWTLFAVVWALALFGIGHDLLAHKGPRIIPPVVALIMGWLALFVLGPLVRAVSWDGMTWIIAGGIFYTVGVAFYASSKKFRHGHAVWHVFVMLGSIAHYVVMIRYVA
jgi:hemolysin III